MSDMGLVVVGAAGRMGLALVRAVHETAGARVVAAIERPGSEAIGKDIGELAGLGPSGVKVSDDPLAAFAKADGVLDFTVPTASVEFAGYAAQARIVHVLGTTGFSADDNARIEAAARHATIVKSGNMSLGEMHHRHKVDAPSGTALLLGEAAAAGRGIPLSGNDVRVRDGHTGPRDTGSIGFASLRGGSVPGDHSVILAGNGETITLSHHAQDRAIFARGAVKAALWARGRKPGLYSMRDVLGL
jgi:4-hydroxy-tetrahydrodipicolinate reductase